MKIESFKIVESDPVSSFSITRNLKQILLAHGFREADRPDVVIAVGGDRAFLTGAHDNKFNTDILYVGINTGSLGFLQDIEASRIPDLIYVLQHPEEMKQELFDILYIKLHFLDGRILVKKAINEIQICGKAQSTIDFAECIGNVEFFNVTANGIVFSTDIGTTGSFMSLGGTVETKVVHRVHSVLNQPIRNGIKTDFISNALAGDRFAVTVSAIKNGIEIVVDGLEQVIDEIDALFKVEIFLQEQQLTAINISGKTRAEKIAEKIIRRES